MELKNTKVEELALGAVPELMNDALQQVIKNVKDPNTLATAQREINVKIKIKPTENREACAYEISCVPKLAANKPVNGHVYVGIQDGEAVAFESNPDQRSFDFNVKEKETV